MAQVHAHIAEMEREIFLGGPTDLQARRNVELAQDRVRTMLLERGHGGSMPIQ